MLRTLDLLGVEYLFGMGSCTEGDISINRCKLMSSELTKGHARLMCVSQCQPIRAWNHQNGLSVVIEIEIVMGSYSISRQKLVYFAKIDRV